MYIEKLFITFFSLNESFPLHFIIDILTSIFLLLSLFSYSWLFSFLLSWTLMFILILIFIFISIFILFFYSSFSFLLSLLFFFYFLLLFICISLSTLFLITSMFAFSFLQMEGKQFLHLDELLFTAAVLLAGMLETVRVSTQLEGALTDRIYK